MKREARAPLIIALVLLLLPMLYLGSYLALADHIAMSTSSLENSEGLFVSPNYRWGGRWAEQFFWPLEQIDRTIRPNAWDPLVPLITT